MSDHDLDEMVICKKCGQASRYGTMHGMTCKECWGKGEDKPSTLTDEILKSLRVGEFKTMTADQIPKKEVYPSPVIESLREMEANINLEEITLRDYYAGQAMLTQVAADMAYQDRDKASEWAWGYADSMMKKRGSRA